MNTQRLLKLADLLDTVPPEQFYIGLWSNSPEFNCNTVACAAGWACSIPEFAEAGLHLQYADDEKTDCSIHYNDEFCNPLEEFFDMSRGEVENIFHGPRSVYHKDRKNITPQDVAALIRKKVRGYDPSRV